MTLHTGGEKHKTKTSIYWNQSIFPQRHCFPHWNSLPRNSHLSSKICFLHFGSLSLSLLERNYHKSRIGEINDWFESPGGLTLLLLPIDGKSRSYNSTSYNFPLGLMLFYFRRHPSSWGQENSHYYAPRHGLTVVIGFR